MNNLLENYSELAKEIYAVIDSVDIEGRLYTMDHQHDGSVHKYIRESGEWKLIETKFLNGLFSLPPSDHRFTFVWTDDGAGEVEVTFSEIAEGAEEYSCFDTDLEAHNGDCWSPFMTALRSVYAVREADRILKRINPAAEYTRNDY